MASYSEFMLVPETSFAVSLIAFAASAGVVWYAGARLPIASTTDRATDKDQAA